MSAKLQVTNFFNLTALSGLLYTGKQGATADGQDTPYEPSVTGVIHQDSGQITTGTVATLWNAGASVPGTFNYFFFWADKDVYVQLIGPTKSITLKVTAYLPLAWAGHLILPATTTAAITGTEPVGEAVTLAYCGNYSGSTATFAVAVIQ